MDAPDNWIVQDGRDPPRELKALQKKFALVSARQDRRIWLRNLYRAALWPVPALFFIVVFAGLVLSPFTPMVTLRHILAMPNCASARWMNLAPAGKGQPGYWPWLDRDRDGIACEVWSRV